MLICRNSNTFLLVLFLLKLFMNLVMVEKFFKDVFIVMNWILTIVTTCYWNLEILNSRLSDIFISNTWLHYFPGTCTIKFKLVIFNFFNSIKWLLAIISFSTRLPKFLIIWINFHNISVFILNTISSIIVFWAISQLELISFCSQFIHGWWFVTLIDFNFDLFLRIDALCIRF